MLSFVVAEEIGGPVQDDETLTTVWNAVAIWMGMGLIYHFAFSIVTGQCPYDCWLRITCKEQLQHMKERKIHYCRRLQRFYRCQRRANKRKAKSENWDCPFYTSFMKLHMPPPLPYNRRRNRASIRNCCFSKAGELVGTEHARSTNEVRTVRGGCLVQKSTKKPDRSAEKTPKEKRHRSHKKKRRSTLTRTTTSSPLIDLARMQHWVSLAERAQFFKEEASHTDSDGLMPLHWTCSGGPPKETVRALLEAYPKASSAVDNEGSTALHFACHYGASAEVLELLLQHYAPGVRVQDKYGRTPLYHAVDKAANLEVLKILVEADPRMITKACYQPSYKSSSRRRSWDKRPMEHRTPLFLAWVAAIRSRQQSGKAWDKAHYLLSVAYADLTANRVYRVLHASIEFDAFLPKEVLGIALKRHPEQVKQKDVRGRLPLALAAASRKMGPERARVVIERLLQAFPSAAQIFDSQGRFPLALAAASGKTWEHGLGHLFYAGPEMIRQPDGASGLLPVLASAAAKLTVERGCASETLPQTPVVEVSDKMLEWRNQLSDKLERNDAQSDSESPSDENQHLSTVFQLLRCEPSVLRSAQSIE